MTETVGVAIITHNAAAHMRRCLPPIVQSTLAPRILVVNSSSTDGTVDIAREMNVEVLVIPRHEFNHGATRELARRTLGTDIVVMMTPDAYLTSPDALAKLVAPIRARSASVSYGRQIPRSGADFFESYLRSFNYPATSHVRSIEDADTYGAYSSFCSNAFAAYRNSALDQIGGFAPTLAHEDAVAAARVLRAGHRIAYVAEATVTHSHASSLPSEFRRYFDAGYSRAQFAADLEFPGGHERLGRRYVRGLFKAVMQQPWHLPYALAHAATKWIGYKLGSRAIRWSPTRCARFSGQEYYWVR